MDEMTSSMTLKRDSVGYTVRGVDIIDMQGAHLDIISYSVWLEGKIVE